MTKVEGVAIEQEKAMEETKKSFDGVAQAVATISDNIKTMYEESDAIVQNARNAESAVEHVVSVSREAASSTQEVSASTEVQTEAVHKIFKAAEDLSEMAEKLKISIKNFKV